MENEEIDLIEVMAKLWHRKKTIMYIALFFLVGGLVLAFFLPRKYTAQCTLGLEMEDRTTRISVEGMSPFQSMPMGDMRNTRIVSPAMYPDIFFSVPFQKELIYSPLYIDERGDTVTFYNYLVSGPERLALVTDPSQVEQLTEEESKCLAYLKDAFSVKVNNKDGNLKITLEHVTEGHLIVEELAKENVPLAVGPTLTSASKFELRNKSWTTPGVLAAAGCQVSIITDSPVIPQEYLPLCAGLAVKAGMDPFKALQAITINPAKHAGIADRVGSLEEGKDADIVITDGCPFEVSTNVEYVLIDGKVIRQPEA